LRSHYGVKIVEDAACSIGAEYAGKKVGALADITVFSLHPRKFITTGEGGMVTTDRDDWAAWMESYKHFGMGKATDREGIVFERIGSNLKLSNLQAAVGVVQMRHVEELLTRRRSLAAQYTERLAPLQGVTLPVTTERGVHSYQSFCVFVPERDRLLSNLRRDGIEVQIGTAPPRNGAWGDRDRDGVPNVYDRYDNRRTWNNGAWGDRDHDGVPNAYDRFDNRALRDKDHDGVPQAWDRNDNNPWRR